MSFLEIHRNTLIIINVYLVKARIQDQLSISMTNRLRKHDNITDFDTNKISLREPVRMLKYLRFYCGVAMSKLTALEFLNKST